MEIDGVKFMLAVVQNELNLTLKNTKPLSFLYRSKYYKYSQEKKTREKGNKTERQWVVCGWGWGREEKEAKTVENSRIKYHGP